MIDLEELRRMLDGLDADISDLLEEHASLERERREVCVQLYGELLP